MSKTDENLKIAFNDESQTNIEYLAYAHRAIDDGLMEIAQLFREAAGAEVVHALSHLKVMGAVKTTKGNLKDAAEGEDLEIMSIYPKFIEEAEAEGRGRSRQVLPNSLREGEAPPGHVSAGASPPEVTPYSRTLP